MNAAGKSMGAPSQQPPGTGNAVGASDTIVALATPPAASTCGLLRLSGPAARAIAGKLFRPEDGSADADNAGWSATPGRLRLAPPAKPTAGPRRAAGYWCPCLLYRMRAPRTYTGEDMAEILLPGSPPLLATCLHHLCRTGARPARAGEFTFRAVINGKLDLGQAESVERLVHARGEAQRRDALARLAGDSLGPLLRRWQEELLATAADVEAEIDLEEPEPNDTDELAQRLGRMREHCAALAARPRRRTFAELIPRVRLLGATNAGKTSLVNALLGRPAGVVSSQAHTTRDRCEHRLALDGVEVMLEDTAGQDRAARGLARAAAARALEHLSGASLLLLVVDLVAPDLAGLATWFPRIGGKPTLLLLNKVDLLPTAGAVREQRIACVKQEALRRLKPAGVAPTACLCLSAATGEGLDALRAAIARRAQATPADTGGELSQREAHALATAAECLTRARRLLSRGREMELVSEELRAAYEQLDCAQGRSYAEDVLASMFARFCVGK